MNARRTLSGTTSALIEPCRKKSMSFADHVGTCSLSVCVDESCTAASVPTAVARRITVTVTNRHACAAGATRLNNRLLTCLLQQSLSAGDTNDHGRNVLCIDEGVEVFRASKIGKMNDVVRY